MLAVVGDLLVVARVGGRGLGAMQTAVKEREHGLRADRPVLARRGEPVGGGGALQPTGTQETEHGEVRRARYADVGIGGGHAPLGGGDIGTALEQLGGESGSTPAAAGAYPQGAARG